MKRFLLLLLCLLLCTPALAETPASDAGFVGVWIETDDYGTLTIRLDGTADMRYYDGTESSFRWEETETGARFTDGMWYNSPMVLLDRNTLSVANGWMVFAREGFLPTTDEALLLGATPVGEDGAPFLGKWNLTRLVLEGQEVDPALFSMVMTLTFHENGLVVSDDGWEPYTTTWFASYGSAVVEGDILTIDEEDRLVYNAADGQMIFVRVVEATPTPEPTAVPTPEPTAVPTAEPAAELTAEPTVEPTADPDDDPFAEPAPAVPVPVSGDALALTGIWTLISIDMDGMTLDPALFGMTMIVTLNEDGTASVDDGEEVSEGVWQYADGAALLDGMPLVPDDAGCLVMEEDGARMVFTQGEVAPGEAPSEMEQWLALMALMESASGTEEDLSLLPEELQLFVGEWHLCYCATGGLTGDLRTYGVTGTLILHADGSGVLSGVADEEGFWYDDEGVIRFGESGMPMQLLGDPEMPMDLFLQYGSEMGGYMIFHQDEEAVWDPAMLPAATAAPAASAPAGVSGALLTDTRYVCRQYTAAGMTMDADLLGAEYALVFHESTADMTLGGFTIENLPYSVTEDGRYSINHFGTLFVCTPTESGLDMDYYGTMIVHFVPAD